MDEDIKKSTELMKKLSESQTLIYIGEKTFQLNEMSIKQVKDFAIKAVSTVDIIAKKTGIDVTKIEVTDLIGEYSELLFTELTTLFNWVFAYKNPEYIKVTKAWISNNVSIRILTKIVKEIAVQNKLDWLGPFFKGKITNAVEIALR